MVWNTDINWGTVGCFLVALYALSRAEKLERRVDELEGETEQLKKKRNSME
jgi:hypothetical protein